jgi:hypothetical protein
VEAEDVLIEKSRDMGASWVVCATFEWAWHFREMLSFLLVSRNENLVDDMTDPDSLFWKLRFLLDKLPAFLRPRYTPNKLRLHNEDSGSTIDGESTTGDVGRGGRRTAILLDEFGSFESVRPGSGKRALSATADTTRCRVFNSTPKGTANAFYQRRQQMTSSGGKVLRFHWSQHPVKKRGLYRFEDGKVVILDKEYKFGVDYPFVKDGKLRAPWYDGEEKRRGSRTEMGQELDIDYLAAGSQFYDEEAILRMEREAVRSPLIDGDDALDLLKPFLVGKLLTQDNLKAKVGFRIWTPLDPRLGPVPAMK